MYWEGQRDIKMVEKEDKHLDEFVFMVQMVPINGTSMQHMTYIPMKVKLDKNIQGENMLKYANEGYYFFLVENIHKIRLNTLNS